MSENNYLIVGPAWVGDMVMAQSLFKLLRRNDPGATIDVVAPAWSVPLVERMPEVRRAHILSVGHGEVGLGTRRTLGRKLRDQDFSRAIVLPRSFKAALVPWHAGIPMRTGYRGEMRFGLLNDRRELDKSKLPTTVSRYAALGLPQGAALPKDLPQPALRSDPQRADALRAQLDLTSRQPVIALLPGAEYGPAKQWPAERFAQLARALGDAGMQVWVLGSAKEAPLGEEICAGSDARNLCGRTELVDVVDLLSCASVAVSNDSGLMHIAAATNCAVIAIYGSSSPVFTPPLTQRARIMLEAQPCSPCFARTCRYDHYRCLTDISVQSVNAAVTEILGE